MTSCLNSATLPGTLFLLQMTVGFIRTLFVRKRTRVRVLKSATKHASKAPLLNASRDEATHLDRRRE